MKIALPFQKAFPKKEESSRYFFSLYIDSDAAAVAVWLMGKEGVPVVESHAYALVTKDSWEERLEVVDSLLTQAEDAIGITKPIEQTVFGLPGGYLTREGNIAPEVRTHLKSLSSTLDLTPLGFVPVSQALAFSLKKEEGVPPSVILLGISADRIVLTLFRVGQPMGEEIIPSMEDPAPEIEKVLKTFQDDEVLPSRMLLYGGNAKLVEQVRMKLLKYPWPTRANFIHFPKIETIPVQSMLTAVSLAGASELAYDLGVSEADQENAATTVAQPSPTGQKMPDREAPARDTQTQEAEDVSGKDDPAEDEDADVSSSGENPEEDTGEAEDEETEDELLAKSTLVSHEPEVIPQVSQEKTSPRSHAESLPEEYPDDVANIEVVTPESLGFRSAAADNAGPSVPDKPRMPAVDRDAVLPAGKQKRKTVAFSPLAMVAGRFTSLRLPDVRKMGALMPRGGKMPVAAVALLVLAGLGYYLAYTVLPRSTVTILVSPQRISETATLAVSAQALAPDPEGAAIPAKSTETSVSGEKTVPATGKKNVGDPAKGTVTLYNKVTSERSLKKGTAITAKGLSFTLDNDIRVASASESIGSITFGKANVTVTAAAIGADSNLPSGTEFTVKDVGSSQVIARNEAAFTGGTSRQVTVVSRSDMDKLVKSLTEELVAKAKTDLASQVGGDRLIDQTVKTQVTERSFSEEIDQEAKDLHGSITVSITGLSIRDDDVRAVLGSMVDVRVPGGYEIVRSETAVSVGDVAVKKDGSISVSGSATASALPKLDIDAVRGQIAGKRVSEAEMILKNIPGVAGVEFEFRLSPTKLTLPKNPGNITIASAVVQ